MSKNIIIRGLWTVVMLMFFELWLCATTFKWHVHPLLVVNFYIMATAWFFMLLFVFIEDWNDK